MRFWWGTLCFGVGKFPASVCLCPVVEAWSGENEPRWPGRAGGAIPEWKGSSDPVWGRSAVYWESPRATPAVRASPPSPPCLSALPGAPPSD